MQFENIKSFDYTVEFHDIHLYYNDNKMEYLFNFHNKLPHNVDKKYLIPVDIKEFNQFVKDCLEYSVEKLSQSDFESIVIQLIDKYKYNYSLQVLKLINIKLGSLILSNPEYKNFDYLKKLEKEFSSHNKLSKNDNPPYFYAQIRYLIIMLNNLVSVRKTKNPVSNYKIIQMDQFKKFDYLDFVFDYWS